MSECHYCGFPGYKIFIRNNAVLEFCEIHCPKEITVGGIVTYPRNLTEISEDELQVHEVMCS